MGSFKGKSSSVMENAALLCLVALFFFLAMGAVVMGVSAYQGVSEAAERNTAYRTALAYVTNQVRRADAAGGVSAGEYQGLDALIITEVFGDYFYDTYIYCYDGSLRELFVERGYELEPAAGTELLPLESMAVAPFGDGLIKVSVVDAAGVSGGVVLGSRSAARGEE
jgi:hypothetical protein